MTIGELMAMMNKIKIDGNSVGLTDLQIGSLEICEITSNDKGQVFNPVNLTIEFAQANDRRSKTKENFIYFEKKKGKLINVKFKA